jgi:hypothetical protein
MTTQPLSLAGLLILWSLPPLAQRKGNHCGCGSQPFVAPPTMQSLDAITTMPSDFVAERNGRRSCDVDCLVYVWLACSPDDAFTLASLLMEISGEPRQGGTGYVAPRSGKVHFDGTPKLTFYSICPNLIVHKYLEL